MLLSWSREKLFWPWPFHDFHDHGVKTTLGVETTLSRCRNYPLSKGTEITPRVKKNTVKSTLLNLQCRPVPITIHYDMNYVYEITLVVICEMYNFIICEIYDLIFIYENSHMKLPNSHMKWISWWNLVLHMWIV